MEHNNLQEQNRDKYVVSHWQQHKLKYLKQKLKIFPSQELNITFLISFLNNKFNTKSSKK